jgi:hypothetical protein
MAEKLSRIIRENEASKSEATKNIIQEIKKYLIEISKENQKPDLSLELETDFEISIPFERKLTFEQTEKIIYDARPQLADEDIAQSDHINKLFSQKHIDKDLLRKRIRDVLKSKSQTSLYEVIDNHGGIKNGLPELFGYIGIVNEFKYSISTKRNQRVIFDPEKNKSIQIPEIIITK